MNLCVDHVKSCQVLFFFLIVISKCLLFIITILQKVGVSKLTHLRLWYLLLYFRQALLKTCIYLEGQWRSAT